MSNLKSLAHVVRYGRPWRAGHLGFLLKQVYHRCRNRERAYSDRDHMFAAAQWLETAQDITGDGGVCGRYILNRGWSSSYPETTGYILPTFLALSKEPGAERFQERARKCREFLLPLQLPSGAFPGGEIAQIRNEPSPFNTAQILHGLTAWHRATGDECALAAARRAGDWLLSVQDDDGAFRKHFYLNVTTTYSTHASCWLAELGDYTGDQRYLEGARRHLDWALTFCDAETGWFDCCGFYREDHEARRSVTHTIAYTLWGVLFTAEILGREDGIDAVRKAAEGIARRLELSRRLPGVLDHRWKARADYVCLTGNAQMALIWMRLHAREPNFRFLNAALNAIDDVKAAQHLENPNPGLRGGIAGSDPAWGGYISNAVPNWAAKYFIDALMEKERSLARLEERPMRRDWFVPADVPTELPEANNAVPKRDLKVVVLTTPRSKKPEKLLRAWRSWGFKPDAIVVEQRLERSAWVRLRERVRENGLGPILQKLPLRRKARREGSDGSEGPDGLSSSNPADLSRTLNVDLSEVPSLRTPEGVDALRAIQPDLVVFAGDGILRAAVLDVPRLGTLNAHMGVLPYYRGMNVAEWATLQQDPVGCTVHVIDAGIDTGDILCVRVVDVSSAKSVAELRNLVDEAQLALLGEVLRYVMRTGELPPRRKQETRKGVQFFRMHDDLRDFLEKSLHAGLETVCQ